jgi:hypothetical protein
MPLVVGVSVVEPLLIAVNNEFKPTLVFGYKVSVVKYINLLDDSTE